MALMSRQGFVYAAADGGRLLFSLALAGGCAAFIAVVVLYSPLLALVLCASALALALLLGLNQRLPAFFLGTLGVLLAGYAFFGRGFAYVGAPPIYIGELVLGVAVLSLLISFDAKRIDPLHWMLLLFMAWGAARTLPYIQTYGIDSVRDAVIWGYALFAIAVSFAMTRTSFESLVGRYRQIVPIFIIWAPIAVLITRLAIPIVPTLPGSDTTLLDAKGGDMGVHLAGLAAFVILGLYSMSGPVVRLSEAFFWSLWFVALAIVGSTNRGGLVAAMVGCMVAIAIRPSQRTITILLTAVAIIVLVSALNLRIDSSSGRPITLTQIQRNVTSVFSTQDRRLSSTREWRLEWWGKIIDYTINGRYFWQGKGFGINLANADGFQVLADDKLRSPHNTHMAILAHTGVPGFSLWLLIQGTFAVRLMLMYLRQQKRGNTLWAQIDAWLLIYWLAMIVNTSFDPYIEGPQGGIWFWSVFGAGIAALVAQREQAEVEERAVAPQRLRLGPEAYL